MSECQAVVKPEFVQKIVIAIGYISTKAMILVRKRKNN
jgi:hypothetical protein